MPSASIRTFFARSMRTRGSVTCVPSNTRGKMRRNANRDSGFTSSTSSSPSSSFASGVIFIPPPSETLFPRATSTAEVSMTFPSSTTR